MIQNAGSGFDDVYNGYDIGFCKPDGEEYSKTYELTNGCGASIIMRKKDFDACGGFDEQFFMYYEDTDLSFRMKAGWRKDYVLSGFNRKTYSYGKQHRMVSVFYVSCIQK